MCKLLRALLPSVLLSLPLGLSAGELTVSAASSLTSAFRDIARAYEAANPQTRVRLNFGGSGALLQQIAKGAPVDVFASADQETLDQATGRKLIEPASRRDFAGNELVLVVPRTGPPLTRLEDLSAPEVERIALGNPASVPAGRYAMRALDAAGLWPALRPKAVHTQNVRQALDYVARGEVSAGFVYATDTQGQADRVTLAFPVALQEPIRYPVAVVRRTAQPAEAQHFIDYLLSPAGQQILVRHGFQQP